MSAPRSRWVEGSTLVLGVGLVALGLFRLSSHTEGIERRTTTVDGTPVTVLVPATSRPAPAVVVAHGFAGSRTLMQAFSLTLARSGYVAVAFDFPGHGDHPRPLGGTLGSPARTASLRAALEAAVGAARELDASDGRVALLGHSMAGEILVRHAQDDPDIAAIVGLSPYLSEAPAAGSLGAPLLVAYGGFEPELLSAQGRAAVAAIAEIPPAEVEPGRTYGEGPRARRLAIIEGAEHIGILFSPPALREAVTFLDAAFSVDRIGPAPLAPRRAGLLAYYLGVVLIAFALARRLPVVSEASRGAGLRGRRFAVAALGPAVLTPVLLSPVSTDFLPSLLADHLALHFAVYGLLTAAASTAFGVRPGDLVQGLRAHPFAIALAAVVVFQLGALGWGTDRMLATYFPGPGRGLTTLAVLAGATLWSVADEWLTRGEGAQPAAYLITKVCFLASLLLGVALNPGQLFFLVIIVPAILVLFLVHGLLSRWIHAGTGHPLVAALAHALAFALVVSATFPVVTDEPQRGEGSASAGTGAGVDRAGGFAEDASR